MGCISSKSGEKVADPETKEPDTNTAAASSNKLSELGGNSGLSAPAASGLREVSEKPLIIFVIGGPGSGKGTQCAKIVQKYEGGCRHISTGDLLRAEVKKGSELGKILEETMKSGSLVTDEQMITLLQKEINSSTWFGLAFLVDGFPRATTQAQHFEEQVRPCDLVLYFECPENVMVDRLTERAKTSGRKDDNPETVKQRLKTFQKQSLPVVKHYENQDKLCRISAVPPPEEVFTEVCKILDKKFKIEKPDAQSTEGAQWRSSLLVDIENKFYGAGAESSAIPSFEVT